jgi:hypothetical protein
LSGCNGRGHSATGLVACDQNDQPLQIHRQDNQKALYGEAKQANVSAAPETVLFFAFT